MADFVAVLKKTIDGLADNTPEIRQRVYAKARDTVAAKLAAITPAPPQVAIDRQWKALEEAIGVVEANYASDPDRVDDFDSVLAELETGARVAAPAPLSLPPLSPPAAPIPAHAPVPTQVHATAAPQPAARPSVQPAAPRLPPASPPVESAGTDAPRTERLQSPPALESGSEPDRDEGDQAEQSAPLVAVAPSPRPVPALPRATFDPAAGDEDERAAAPRRRVPAGLIAAAVALLVVAGAGYGVWLNRDAFSDMLGLGGNVVAGDPAATEQPAAETAAEPAPAPAQREEQPVEVAAAQPEPPAAPAAAARTDPAVQKFTQRLNADGTETDPGRAGGEPRIGEGTSLAAATETAPSTTATDAQPVEAALPVGQRAIFYEERTSLAEGSADNGATVWSLVQESPGGDLPPEPAVRAEVSVPSRDLSIRMTIRRNADPSLPASHIVEMIFITSGTFEGGGVQNVLRIAFKNSEAAPGAPLIGIPAKIADGYFLVALSDNDAERNQNTQLMLREPWIDIPIVYRSGRRALVTMEKGLPGAKVFEDAIRAWQGASSG